MPGDRTTRTPKISPDINTAVLAGAQNTSVTRLIAPWCAVRSRLSPALATIAIAPVGAAGSAGARDITARVPFVVAAHILGASA